LSFTGCTKEDEVMLDEAVDTTIEATDRARHMTTTTNIQNYARAIELFLAENAGVVSNIGDTAALENLLRDRQVLAGTERLTDAWGKPLIFKMGRGIRDFTLMSYGADGVPGGEKEYDKDIIWENGGIR
jgi:hypothetical protein